MSTKTFSSRLAKFNKKFKENKKRADELGGFGEYPDGKYKSRLISCELKESSAGNLNMVFVFEIKEAADESLVGAKVSKWCDIEREDGLSYLIRDLRRFGIEIEDATDIEKVAALLDEQKPEVKITLKTGNSGQFTYIDKVLEEIEAGDFATEDDEDEEEDEGEEDSGEEESEEDEEAEEEGEEEEAEEEEAASDEVSIDVGSMVKFTSKAGKELTGKVTKILEDEEKAKVAVDGKIFTVEADRLSVVEDEEEEEEGDEEEVEEVKEKPKAKKSAPKKAPAKKVTGKNSKSTSKRK